jgi:Tfp pilus assembly protein PilF
LLGRIVAQDADNAEAWLKLGVARKALRDLAGAAACFERVVLLQPAAATAHYNLGVVLQELHWPQEALLAFDRAISLRPDYAKAHGNRAAVLGVLQRNLEALESCDRALALVPRFPEAHNNRGTALGKLGRYEEALSSYEQALALLPDYPDAHDNRGTMLGKLGWWEEAWRCYERALAADPQHANANYNLGLLGLRMGRVDAAWRRCEARWRRPGQSGYRHADTPSALDAPTLDGRRVLLWSEQGAGDTVQFCRYASVLAARGVEVVMEVQPTLKGLLSSLPGVAHVLADGEVLPQCDLQLPLLSLPLLLDMPLPQVAANTPYLQANSLRRAQWERRLGAAGRLPRIGIACSGNPAHTNDMNRSMPLAAFAPLFDIAEIYLLQKELCAADEVVLRGSLIHDLRTSLDDFDDTAAIVTNLDLVIAVDTSVVHVAGALARTVWVLLSRDADWRWMLDREDSPWYPSLRRFRQARLGDWPAVMARVVAELQVLTGGAPGTHTSAG